MARAAAEYLKMKYGKPGNVFVGVVSRLDSLVSGVLVLARTSKSASRLSEQIREKTPSKRYLALVEGELDAPNWLHLHDWVIKDESEQRMKIVTQNFSRHQAAGTKNDRGQEARLRVKNLACSRGLSLVEVDLQTGRKHQIRLQMSAAGHAILGDRKYGATQHFSPGIGLHCFQLTINHPTKHVPMMFKSPPGKAWWRFAPQLMDSGMAKLSDGRES